MERILHLWGGQLMLYEKARVQSNIYLTHLRPPTLTFTFFRSLDQLLNPFPLIRHHMCVLTNWGRFVIIKYSSARRFLFFVLLYLKLVRCYCPNFPTNDHWDVMAFLVIWLKSNYHTFFYPVYTFTLFFLKEGNSMCVFSAMRHVGARFLALREFDWCETEISSQWFFENLVQEYLRWRYFCLLEGDKYL